MGAFLLSGLHSTYCLLCSRFERRTFSFPVAHKGKSRVLTGLEVHITSCYRPVQQQDGFYFNVRLKSNRVFTGEGASQYNPSSLHSSV